LILKQEKPIHSGKNFIKKKSESPEGEPGCNPNGLEVQINWKE
jgi:uncharacterized protein with von Willebrand factor type A (vWA) domain